MPKRDDDHLYVTGQRNERGQRICGSRRTSWPRNTAPCQSVFIMPNGRCRKHGGDTPRGIASVHYKGVNPDYGRYGKALPQRLGALWEESRSDPVKLELEDDISLVLVRINELISKLDAGESGSLWREALSTFEEFEQAQRLMQEGRRNKDESVIAKASTSAAEALTKHRTILKRGAADYAVWQEIVDLIEQRRKLVESQRKRQIEQLEMVATEQVLFYVYELARAIKAHAENILPPEYQKPLLQEVAKELRKLDSASDG